MSDLSECLESGCGNAAMWGIRVRMRECGNAGNQGGNSWNQGGNAGRNGGRNAENGGGNAENQGGNAGI